MRIMMLAQLYPPFLGGEERFAQDLSVALAARGHDVSVVTSWQNDTPEFEIDRGVRVYRVHSAMQRAHFLHADPNRTQMPSFPDPAAANALRRILAQEQPEIVHALNWMVFTYLPFAAWQGAKLVLSVCDHSFICPKKKLIYHDAPCTGPGLSKCLSCTRDHYGLAKGAVTLGSLWAMRQIERRTVNLCLPVSTSVAETNQLDASGIPYEVLPNFVADDITTPHGDNDAFMDQLPAGDFMLYVGAFGRYKGVDVLLEAYRRLSDAPPLVIIGYETNEYPVQTQDVPANVTVLKNWPNHAVMEAWRRSSLALVPSTWAEPFGIVALEAMAMGKPVIASRIGGLADIIVDDESGLLVTPDDPADLAAAMQRLCAAPALRRRMGVAAQARVQHFTASAVVPRYEAAYAALLGGATPAVPAGVVQPVRAVR